MHPHPPSLIVIAGPQASGKSTLARTLVDHLREDGERAALVELDQIAGMALPTLPSWQRAHELFEAVTAMWARSELTCVVAEGSGSADEVARLLRQAPPGAATVSVATTTSLETAFARAQADPSRGVSKELSFLREVYAAWRPELERMRPDVVLDTGSAPSDACVDRVEAALAAALDEDGSA